MSILAKLNKKTSPSWLVLNQLVSRAAVGAKFLILATLLGPEALGVASIVLVIQIIIEAVTETGLMQAYTQSVKPECARTNSAVWLVQFYRGVIIFFALIGFAKPISFFFSLPELEVLVYFAAVVPLLRNSRSIGQCKEYKECNFKGLAAIDLVSVIFDFCFSVLFALNDYGAASIIYGLIIGELCKLIMTWWWYPIPVSKNPDWLQVKQMADYGKWIWFNSVLNVFANQYDKLVTGKLVGAEGLGNLQMASKITQLVYLDIANTVATYLFPKLSQENRDKRSNPYFYFKGVATLISIFFIIITVCLVFAIYFIDDHYFKSWVMAVEIVLWLIPGQVFSAAHAIYSSYLRAIGNPKSVTTSVIIQAASNVFLTTPLCFYYGLYGAVIGSTVAIALSLYVLIKIK